MNKSLKSTPTLKTYPEMKGFFLLGLSIVMLLSFLSFHPHSSTENWLGLIGYTIGYALSFSLGVGSFIFIVYVGYLGFAHLGQRKAESYRSKNIYFLVFLISCCFLLNLIAEIDAPFPDILSRKVPVETIAFHVPYPQFSIRHNLGGVPLYYLYCDLPTLNLKQLLSNVGIVITFSFTTLVSFLFLTETNFAAVWKGCKRLFFQKKPVSPNHKPIKKIEAVLTTTPPEPLSLSTRPRQLSRANKKESSQPKPSLKPIKRRLALIKQKVVNGDFSYYKIPSQALLSNPKPIDQSFVQKDVRKRAKLLEETLLNFGIEAKVGEIHIGPTITSFEVQPSVGVKVQKIKALSSDIALNMEAKSIRIIAPIPGKAAVGVEIPSLIPQEVSFRELLINYQKKKIQLDIPILLGKTVSGEVVMSDLAKMPHCIIAGATGSGKSVCINTIVMSIVMNAKPDEIRLLMVDPKKVELTGYTNLPHMVAPVITEAHGAYAALSWLVKEMQKRYDILKQMGLRNIDAFNQRKRDAKFEQGLNIDIPEKLPKFVAIIDEFADLMMASTFDLETPIARIAQMARAVGIHLILATQRPSREVITGLIKANFPTRISFKVASRINSQIILDEVGAENLLGNGDMLFLPPGSSHLLRAQGTYISDEEINTITAFICNQAPPKYLIPSFDTMPKEELDTVAGIEDTSKDSLYDEALSIIVGTGTASATFLQRKLKIGYARAAGLMDELEQNGVIGPQEGAKPRRVLIKSSDVKG